MVRPWAEAGHTCWCFDIRHPEHYNDPLRHPIDTEHFDSGGVIIKYKWDALQHGVLLPYISPSEADIIFAFPPCDHLAISGARWFKGKGLHKLAEAIKLVAIAADICNHAKKFWMLENPVSTLSTYWRKPDHKFDPCDYGDPYTKKTCLWTSDSFIMPEKKPVKPTEGSKILSFSPSEDRKHLRSETPIGFANAVFNANHSNAEQKDG